MIKDKETKDLIGALSSNPSEAAVISLTTIALYAALNNPGEAMTKVLIGAAIKAIKVP
ncbi:hypothetical protein F2Q68_00038282 [Brassica cretica]|uniref:Uncharacterized protein n=2 Tax=Brassica cretica TaxID=69181 RepID=A0A3N6QWG3_BRACR|nr:hypothetical protein F2Q68_00038282 [Brassica cretica]KAF3496919.1 hypothetical protein DY000_02051876 [Brassica cretica]